MLAAAAGWVLRSIVQPSSATRPVQLQRLTDLVGLEEAPALSPDGRTVAFVAVAGGETSNLGAAAGRRIAARSHRRRCGSLWSALVGRFEPRDYYTPGRQPGETGTIWEIPALGGVARRLVGALGPGDLSHDGRSLAFFRFREGAFELAVAPLDRLDAKPIATLPTGISSNLRWSPDDRQLAYLQEIGGFTFSTQLMIADVSGGSPRVVAHDSLFQGITWLADGSA